MCIRDRDLFTVEEKMDYILDLLAFDPKVTFQSIFCKNTRSVEKVITFLAVLELMKKKKISIDQKSAFQEIVITAYKERENYETGKVGSGR